MKEAEKTVKAAAAKKFALDAGTTDEAESVDDLGL